MALIPCKECGKSVSTQAYTCPHCGAPQRESLRPPIQPPPLIKKKSEVAEETIYSDNMVTVTGTRIVVGRTTYALRNVTSVKMVSTPPQIGGAILLLIFGSLILLAALMPLNDTKAPSSVYVIGGVMIVGAVLWMFTAKTHFHIGLSTASGELHVLTSKDKAYIQRIVQCINDAIVRYQ